MAQQQKSPADFLKSIKGTPVLVKLNSGVDYRGGPARREGGSEYTQRLRVGAFERRPTPEPAAGILACLDGYMNIAMEQTEVGLVRGAGGRWRIMIWVVICRRACARCAAGVRERAIEKQVWGRLHPREQR